MPIHPDRLQLVYDKKIKPPIPIVLPPMMSEENEKLLTDTLNSSDLNAECEDMPSDVEDNSVVKPSISDSVHSTPDNGDSFNLSQSQLPRPRDSDISVVRIIHKIPKARTIKNVIEYYIIYDDQQNKLVGEYIPENKLNNYEKEYISKNSDKIIFMRRAEKHPKDLYAVFSMDI
jgi:hypothetical protein